MLGRERGVLLRASLGCSLEPLCQSSVASILRELRRGAAFLVDDSGVGFGLKQLLHHGLMAIARGHMQRGPPIALHGIEVGLSLDEVCHHGLATLRAAKCNAVLPRLSVALMFAFRNGMVCKEDGMRLRIFRISSPN